MVLETIFDRIVNLISVSYTELYRGGFLGSNACEKLMDVIFRKYWVKLQN